MERLRKPLQGVANIVRFNRHFYVLSAILILLTLIAGFITHGRLSFYFLFVSVAILIPIFTSLLISFYVYDLSDLYTLNWLDKITLPVNKKMVNINAGFDETSSLLQEKYPNVELIVFDFYDAEKHTELSIKRARKAYPPFAGTQAIATASLPLPYNSIDTIYLILAAHEIRNNEERIVFFKELKRVINEDGKIIITEHLRDLPNFLAYTIGFLHFYSKATWHSAFKKAGLTLENQINVTPFITTFIVSKNGNPY